MLHYASSAPAHCPTDVLKSGKRGAGLTSKPQHPRRCSARAHTSWEHARGSLPACASFAQPLCTAPAPSRDPTPHGSGSLSARKAMHSLRNSSKARGPLSPASQHRLMESEGHPVSRINFALWCQSRVVQFIMGFNPCSSRCK